jgi:hypothetical protein
MHLTSPAANQLLAWLNSGAMASQGVISANLSDQSSSSSTLDWQIIVGIAVGGVVLVIVIAALIIVLVFRHKRKSRKVCTILSFSLFRFLFTSCSPNSQAGGSYQSCTARQTFTRTRDCEIHFACCCNTKMHYSRDLLACICFINSSYLQLRASC